MRLHIRLVSAAMAFLLIFANCIVSQAAFEDYQDVAGHWAQPYLRKAYNDGLIVGEGNLLRPNANITTAQLLTILCRALGTRRYANISSWGLPQGEWYNDSVAKAAFIGLISSSEITNITAPLSRQNAFHLISEAFALTEAKPDMTVLNRFSDSSQIVYERRQAVASLVSQGLISGNNGKLNPTGNATRAEIITVLYRIINDFLPVSVNNRIYTHGVLLQRSARLSGGNFNNGVWFDCNTSDINLDSITAERVVIRSHRLDSLVLGGSTQIRNLTLAAQSGDVTVAPEDGVRVDKLVVGTGSGLITAKGVGSVEVTGNGRDIVIADDVESIIVSGRNNTIHIQKEARINKLELLRTASDCRVVIDGRVNEAEIIGLGASLEGTGYAGKLILSINHTRIDVMYGSALDIIDHGLTGASVRINMPDRLPIGNTLSASAIIENAVPGKDCSISWYINNYSLINTSYLTGKTPPVLSHKFTYSRDMKDSAEVRVEIKYVTLQGEQQAISATRTIKLDNYSKRYWMQLDSANVLRKVITEYRGNFTLAWAQSHDYTNYEKEVWVYAKGYTSSTNYLLWINLACQRVNVFRRNDGTWEHIKTFIVGTGKPSTPTRTGITTTTYKQVNGWTTSTYTVKPVVRFRKGSGYAFHSRLYYPGTSRLKDERIGFPISHGCIRMYDEDIWYLYNYIPDNTTVVIY